MRLDNTSPDFGLIQAGDKNALVDGMRLTWLSLLALNNQEMSDVLNTASQIKGFVLASAPTTDQNNFSENNAGVPALVINFTGGTAFNLTGIANGFDGRVIIILVTGTGAVTIKHQSGSSAAGNRFYLAGGADKAINQYKAMIVAYCNSVWQELSLA